jgi:hypothetical protein
LASQRAADGRAVSRVELLRSTWARGNADVITTLIVPSSASRLVMPPWVHRRERFPVSITEDPMLYYEVSFRATELTTDAYAELAANLAPSVADLAGLVSKIWTGPDEDGRLTGVYLWRDRASLDAFRGGPLDVATNPAFTDVRSRELDVLEVPTRLTMRSATPTVASVR